MTKLSDDAVARTVRAVAWFERRLRNVRPKRARWHGSPISGYQFRVFELKDSLTNGGTAEAYRRAYDAVAVDDATDLEADTFVVWDYIGDREGDGRDDVSTTSSHGAYGIAMRFSGEAVWRVIDLQCP